MGNSDGIEIKVASESWEYEEIHRLNYKTFVEEIPQHQPNEEKMLVDKFHSHNTYIIAVRNNEILGMVSFHDVRPFSLDKKVKNLDSYLPPHNNVCEVRLLAVVDQQRKKKLFASLLDKVLEVCVCKGYDLAVISGTTRQLDLYKHLGFRPFGPLVGTKDAMYKPMYITVDSAKALSKQLSVVNKKEEIYKYIPGPVSTSSAVMEASADEPVSHRSRQFIDDFKSIRQELCERVNAEKVQVFSGSGTLANDVVASHLSQLAGRGLILINGEFGERLVEHALGAGLNFEILSAPDGYTFEHGKIREKIVYANGLSWLWLVHCETSTGVINDIKRIGDLCGQYGLEVCIDAISSIGSCELDLKNVYMATGVSGKGMASMPGLSMVFYKADLTASRNGVLPRYFDLSYYEEKSGIPFTISTNAVYALQAALGCSNWGERNSEVRSWSAELKQSLVQYGIGMLADESCSSDHVITIELDSNISSLLVGKELERFGIYLSYRSEYLIRKNRIQICLMGQCQRPRLKFVRKLKMAMDRSVSEGVNPFVPGGNQNNHGERVVEYV